MPRTRSPKTVFQNPAMNPSVKIEEEKPKEKPVSPQPMPSKRTFGSKKSTPITVFAPKSDKLSEVKPTPEEVVKPEPVEEVIESPVVEEEIVEPEIKETIVETTVQTYNTPNEKNQIYTPQEKSISVSDSDDNWGTIRTIKRKSLKNISQSMMTNNPETSGMILDQKGIETLAGLIIDELSKSFVTKDELQRYVELSLQRIVMKDTKNDKNKRGK